MRWWWGKIIEHTLLNDSKLGNMCFVFLIYAIYQHWIENDFIIILGDELWLSVFGNRYTNQVTPHIRVWSQTASHCWSCLTDFHHFENWDADSFETFPETLKWEELLYFPDHVYVEYFVSINISTWHLSFLLNLN